MIKKLLSTIVAIVMIGTITVTAQTCVPDGQYTLPGIYPDTLVGLPCGQVNVQYSVTITAIIPVDSLYDLGPPLGTINATIDSIVVQDNTGDGVAINGLPPGLIPVCNPPSCGWPGGTSGCILLIGTPTTVGTYDIVVEIDAYVAELVGFGNPPVNMDVVDQYSVVISNDVPPVTTATSTNSFQLAPACNGTATATGGVTYQWDDNAGAGTSAIATGLCAGTYNYAAIDVNGCGSVGSVVVNYVACNPTVSAFTSNSAGLDAVFTNGSSDATSWAWDFGDSFTSTDENPGTHIYAADGTYNVCLTTTNACSADTSCTSVTVSAGGCNPTVAAFSSNDTGLTVMFVDASTDATGWAWDFGDGNTSPSSNPTHTYLVGGTFNVCLVTTNPCSVDSSCTDVVVIPLGVEQEEVASFTRVQAVPNPFSGKTNINFDLKEQGVVHFIVIDRIGKVVYAESMEGTVGANTIEFSSTGLAPGIYMYNMVSGVHSVTGKMTVVK
ncbi:MAG: PKD domain-containing protein [Flavobacteriales bacterium]|nr:PKD domain-containing protein [Flavobacteriales bacterium]